ncbi:MAG: glycosyltransferase family 2 protein [Lachnospiraceae bacterium]|nr:glycosyltransferase family 2 protein [Lachnospiraceae bacterium]
MSMVTVIIPAYNAEKYIHRCLESVVHQSYTDYDVLIVNDGSSDNTENILKEYKSKYPFVDYCNKENGGVSSARNFGMRQLKQSRYVAFVDSDDYVAEEYLLRLMTVAERNQSDVVCSGQYRVTEDDQIFQHVQYHPNEQGKCILRHLNLHGKAYRVDYIRQHNLKFPEGKIYEENSFNLIAYFLTPRIDFLQYEGYYQLVHLNSITTKKIKRENVPFEELEQSVKYVIAHKPYDYNVFEYTLLSFITYFILEANRKHRYFKLKERKSDTSLLQELCDYARELLEKYCPSYVRNPYLSLFKKSDIAMKQKLAVAVFARMLHFKCAKFFVKVFYKL